MPGRSVLTARPRHEIPRNLTEWSCHEHHQRRPPDRLQAALVELTPAQALTRGAPPDWIGGGSPKCGHQTSITLLRGDRVHDAPQTASVACGATQSYFE
jgi:hypothetical protein